MEVDLSSGSAEDSPSMVQGTTIVSFDNLRGHAKIAAMTESGTLYVLVACARDSDEALRTRTVRHISKEEFEAARRAVHELEECLYGLDANVRYAVDDLIRTKDYLLRQMASHSFQMSPGRAGSELEFRILNVCSAIKMYADHIQITLGRRHGQESDVVNQVRVRFSELYDTSLAYRVCSHLRNVLVHSGPGELLSMMLRSESVSATETAESVAVILSRAGFQRRAQNAKVRDEVAELPEDLELIDITLEAASQARKLHEELVPIMHPGLTPAIRQLADIFVEASSDDEWPALMRVSPEATAGTRIQPMPISFEVRQFVAMFTHTKNQWLEEQADKNL
jgi:hypothetical protein